ncbi:hypothetical protein M5K25_013612 [Dendrobium thyrsiflorum]|uniref:RRM domain-containing protein n=1 Tax=Dendrobium thyrsiflorum TaxID=117978 RepID=A0ABD0UTG5_DENTH
MARKRRELPPHVIEVKLEEEQPPSGPSDSEDEISPEEEEEDDDEDEDEDEEDDDDEDEDASEEDELEENNEVEDEEEEDFSSKESIRKLLEPFGKNQLIEIFKEAVVKNPSLLSRIANEAETDTVHRKIFVHGLSWDATSETLAAAFYPFGEIEDCRVITSQPTGRCQGYGFVVLRTRAAAQRALKEPLKMIGGRLAKCKLAYLGPTAVAGQASSDITGRKLYIGHVGSNVNPERLLAFFSKFGEIELGPLGSDPATGSSVAMHYLSTRRWKGTNKNDNTQIAPVVTTETVPTGMKANDFALSYASAAALMGQNLAPGPTTVIRPNVGVGLLNPVAGLSPALSGGVAGVSHQPYTVGGAGIPPQSYVIGPVGSASRGSGISVNSISPSVIGNYGSLAAVHGLGAYQNSAPSAATRPQTGIGSWGGSRMAPFYGQ